jgi:hypothetical protein
MTTITILDADPASLTKTFWPDRTEPYGDAFWYSALEVEAAGIDDLSAVLTEIQAAPTLCIIRGRLIDGLGPVVLRRKDAWGGFPAFFEAVPEGIPWVMCDFDKVPIPADLPPDDRVEYLVRQLPDYMHDVTYHFQFSSSAGVKGWDTISAHVWFWLSEPRTDAEMIRWAEAVGIDEAVMRTVQVHYTAAPIFHGVPDPVPVRSGLVWKARDTAPIPVIPEKPPVKPWNPMRSPWDKPKPAFEQRLAEIGPRLHMPINKAIASYIAAGGRDFEDLKFRIRSRLAGCPTNGQDVSIYTRDAYLDASIRGALRKFGGSA